MTAKCPCLKSSRWFCVRLGGFILWNVTQTASCQTSYNPPGYNALLYFVILQQRLCTVCHNCGYLSWHEVVVVDVVVACLSKCHLKWSEQDQDGKSKTKSSQDHVSPTKLNEIQVQDQGQAALQECKSPDTQESLAASLSWIMLCYNLYKNKVVRSGRLTFRPGSVSAMLFGPRFGPKKMDISAKIYLIVWQNRVLFISE